MDNVPATSRWPGVPRQRAPRPIDERVVVRHAGLKVADIERTRQFYVEVLGFSVMLQTDILLLLSTSGYHHELSFWARESRGGMPAPPEATGLDHIAFLYPTLESLTETLARLGEIGWPIEYASEFPAHIGIHFKDPDGNMLELQWDKPVEDWAIDEHGHFPPEAKFVDVDELMSSLDDRFARPQGGMSARDLGA